MIPPATAPATSHDQLWRAHAACQGLDPQQWYPDDGPAIAARTICATCPVNEDCLQDALMRREQHGVWGGASERVRRHLRRLLAASPHPLRTWCPVGCGCAYSEALADHWGRLASLTDGTVSAVRLVDYGPGATHGKASTYARGCRCADCEAGMRASRARSAARRRDEGLAS